MAHGFSNLTVAVEYVQRGDSPTSDGEVDESEAVAARRAKRRRKDRLHEEACLPDFRQEARRL